MKKILFLSLFFLVCTICLSAEDAKPTLLILDTVSIDVPHTQSSIVYNYIIDHVHRSGGYIIVEREHLEKVVDEMELSMSGVVDEETAVQIGRVTGAHYILLSSLAFSDEEYHLSMRVVSVETAKITNTAVESIKSFSNIDKVVDESVAYLLGMGGEKPPVERFPSVGINYRMGIPRGPTADVLGLTHLPQVKVNYHWGFGWGFLNAGLSVGCNITGAQQNVVAAYNLYSFFTGINVGYRTNFNSPLFLYLEAVPGAALSLLVYPSSVTGDEAIVFRSVGFSGIAEVGAGYTITDKLSVRVFGSLLYTMFSADDLTALSPGIGVSYRI